MWTGGLSRWVALHRQYQSVRSDGTVSEPVSEETELAFKRISEILRLAGLSMSHLVEVVCYRVDVKNNLIQFIPVKSGYFQ
jgi:enamine deaminase RidA (YjgF/YER057c/UK114 family)